MLSERRLRLSAAEGVLCFSCVRNEAERLPNFLDHHRRLGVGHFLFVVNDSADASLDLLLSEGDCSVWTVDASYKAARFGMDWIGWLLARFGQGRWCLTLDADELLIYPHWQARGLADLVAHLEATGRASFGTLSVDLYPQGPLSASRFEPGGDPLAALGYLDGGPYRRTPQPDLGVDLFQGGVRDRVFFAQAPRRAPTMNKVPLVKWHWRYAYRNSTHSVLPPRLNAVFADDLLSGALLHTKFLPSVVARSAEEKLRQQHFARAEAHDAYYDTLSADPVLWSEPHSVAYTGWRQLVEMGLMSDGPWA